MVKKKIIALLSGGMGNQMHQFAYGYFLSNKINAKLLLDVSFYSINPTTINVTSRNYMLHIFNISNCINSIYSNRWIIKIVKHFKIVEYFFEKIFKVQYVFNIDFTIKEECSTIVLVYLFGKLENYEEYKEGITHALNINKEYIDKSKAIINKFNGENKEVIIVHIRRTDYLLSNSVHIVLDKSYYESAIKIMRQRVIKPIFYFIGDDKQWIKSNFDFKNNEDFISSFNQKDDMIVDFTMLTICNHVITSNSTFSWWGSYLNNQKNKIIIAPSKWLKEDVDTIEKRYPSNWLITN